MTDPDQAPAHDFEFDVVLSFAGEDRAYVEDVAAAMRSAGVTYFMDSEHLAELWGPALPRSRVSKLVCGLPASRRARAK